MANPLVTWWALLEQARVSAFVSAQNTGTLDSPQNALIVLSRARRELQDFTRAVRRVVTVTIDGAATDGGYTCPLDIKQTLEAQFTPTGQAKTFRANNISPEAMDSVKREAQWFPPLPTNPPFVVSQWYYMLDVGKVFIYPYLNVVGTLSIRYLPLLHEFEPSNLVGDWAGVTLSTLQTWMKANGPDQEFYASAGAMSDYLAMDLMQKHNVHRAYPERFEELRMGWEKGKLTAVTNTRIQSKGVRMPHRNSPLN